MKCKAKTTKGTRCKVNARLSGYCLQHWKVKKKINKNRKK